MESVRAVGESEQVSALEDDAAYLETAIADAQQRVNATWTDRWQRNIAAASAAHPVRNQPASHTANNDNTQHAENTQHTQNSGTTEQELAAEATRVEQRGRALADVAALLRIAGPRCDPAELDALTGKFTAMSALTEVSDMRAAALDMSVAVRAAVERQKTHDAGEERRAQLLTLLDDALPADQERLHATTTHDGWEAEVHQAVERADRERHRDLVSKAVTVALADAGCDVADDFTELLLTDGQAVVGLDQDYGLLVRLPADGTQLLTAVVRPDDREPDSTQDVLAQQDFCAKTLPDITASLGSNGITVDPTPFLLLEPGRMPVAPVPSNQFRRTARNRPRRTSTQALRERTR